MGFHTGSVDCLLNCSFSKVYFAFFQNSPRGTRKGKKKKKRERERGRERKIGFAFFKTSIF
ncbi:hypothetical protein KFK09_019500 [Dendrobium nobile]|uniref:Uncharacterized protein n=1 Tax=Dendrobium nobile TaxID=94219 RepID=A0A8T3AR49_DENNO|nr:hypothetical protein KFK09_019500 [Dendrobium nobile]